jgi:16S rRNA (guanine966-N2)-methyltransferase
VRVVAGTARGIGLTAPAGRATRPTSDRVREATFNALHSLGAVERARVLDLYAGSGALGIEALSRGATLCTFVESAPAALAALRANVAATGLAARATVVAAPVERYLDGPRASCDLVLIDPPYAFDGWPALLARLAEIDDALVVCESDRAVAAPEGWRVLRSKAYGGTVVTIIHRVPPAA